MQLMLAQYLQRIAYPSVGDSSPQVTPETLRQVHRHHCHAIPFENLTVVHPALKTDSGPSVELVDIHKKLVLHQRGLLG